MLQQENASVFVMAANIAAELHFAVKRARELSLTAKNARVISVRAGEKAAGFRAITDFIDQLSSSTIAKSVNINNTAIRLSRLSVEAARVNSLLAMYAQVTARSTGATYLRTLQPPRQRLQQRQVELSELFAKLSNQLKSDISEVREEMRSATVIASSSKVESTLAGTYEQELRVIADNIEATSEGIKQHLDVALRQIDQH